MKTEQDLISRAIREPEFRNRLLKDPDEVIRTEGYSVGEETQARLKSASTMSPQALEAAMMTAAREGGVGG